MRRNVDKSVFRDGQYNKSADDYQVISITVSGDSVSGTSSENKNSTMGNVEGYGVKNSFGYSKKINYIYTWVYD